MELMLLQDIFAPNLRPICSNFCQFPNKASRHSVAEYLFCFVLLDLHVILKKKKKMSIV